MNEEWLFGEVNDKKGNFPASFVDRVPTDLPKQKVSSDDVKTDHKSSNPTDQVTGCCIF